MLGEPVDLRTIISRTRADWNFCKGDVEYLDMGNHWVLIQFANLGDLFLVWSERPWHVMGELFVIYPWRAHFYPFIEEIKWVDLWVRIPRFPTELLNFESVAKLLVVHFVSSLIKLDFRSLLRHKIRFARACIRVDIIVPLVEYAEIKRVGGVDCGYLICYEDFSVGCSFCGCDAYTI
ncbi:uncharacterized protein LOC104901219 [Beta vulgaris subsp. vulgaris]|uniref:uncharacterized protein LOC104901219 n=1 Tax=Beta vulgaris subsp. vulgaris TaxID=3555 RepID=UPI002037669A|nr:uncharacterized protein LOC104901219 [Beta vulgaris subsp. vulgaris]